MTRVIWDKTGERRYRAGVDRGMLYVGDVAVPWNGLVSVTESPKAGEPTAIYLDGNKVQNVPAGEDFVATIEAFTVPVEFAPCAGRLFLGAGLYATDQPKQTFWFSYRTLTGNDVDDVRVPTDYRIHIVCNALAKIADFSHNTTADKIALTTHIGEITTVPISVPGLRPSAHYVVDTRHVTSSLLNMFEAILYGGGDSDPRIPTVSELAMLLTT